MAALSPEVARGRAPPEPSLTPDLSRVVMHLDLDCFYAQVEAKRLGVPRGEPLAVVQWSKCIAVNYAARACGVKRMHSVSEVRRLCPACQLVHVQTVDERGNVSELPAHDMSERAAALRARHKVSLERYRAASVEVFGVLERYGAKRLERASIDEAYMELTDLIDGERPPAPADGADGVDGTTPCAALSPDARLEAGARLASRIRARVLDELGFTCSAGIAHNKMLAKFASARNKPDKQTVVRWGEVACVLRGAPIEQLRGLGGKLGRHVQQALGRSTAGELAAVPYSRLALEFDGDVADWLYRVARGVDESAVRDRSRPESLLAVKSFEAVRTWAEARHWLSMLAAELDARLSKDAQAYRRAPRTLVVAYLSWDRREYHGAAREGSKSCRFPRDRNRQAVLVQAAERMLRGESSEFCLPCTRLSMQACHFEELAPVRGSIERYMDTAAAAGAGAAARGKRQRTASPRDDDGERYASGGNDDAESDQRVAQLVDMGVARERVKRACRALPPKATVAELVAYLFDGERRGAGTSRPASQHSPSASSTLRRPRGTLHQYWRREQQ